MGEGLDHVHGRPAQPRGLVRLEPLLDERGRVRIFHGSNRVMKAPPWYFADQLHDDREFALMARLGFTVLRLGFMWSGFNPAPGIFNQTYVDIVKTIVGRAAAHGTRDADYASNYAPRRAVCFAPVCAVLYLRLEMQRRWRSPGAVRTDGRHDDDKHRPITGHPARCRSGSCTWARAR